ncbi:Ger(x)C family spore germination protein [Rossellomorea vietnamensis]|uniref:Ger(X)C family spore germination protein n=1 Tax=Rossellomorea vietnamensis TaxID=218284 RepID=A0A5D4M7E3_9BACI|nr:Ger(x)C family spore germination protein [Rossellomorea vietnamensis]TYR97408.1 Ger(x)C family spore germination protein [Rossellomorea vietnamensis]
MRKLKIFLTVLLAVFSLSGCSSLKNIQDLTYIVSMGMDYDEESKEFNVFIQGLNFANVAKQEGSRPTEPVPIFVASASGETLNLAVSKLYKKSEPPLFFGHVVTLVLTENVMKQKFQEVINEIGRNRSLRPTLRVVVSKEKLEDTLTTKALFDYPAIYTVLFKGKGNELSQDEIKPMILMNFLRDYYEPMGAAKVPTVKIDKESWEADKEFPVLYFDGYAVFQHQEYRANLNFQDALLTNWISEKGVVIDHKVEKDGELIAAVKLSSPKMKIKYEEDPEKPKFSITLSLQGDLLEKVKDIPLKDLEAIIIKDFKKKLTSLYETGVENQTDILDAGEKWYREHPQKYKELKESKKFYLDKNSLTDVRVNVTMVHFNSYKYDTKYDKE